MKVEPKTDPIFKCFGMFDVCGDSSSDIIQITSRMKSLIRYPKIFLIDPFPVALFVSFKCITIDEVSGFNNLFYACTLHNSSTNIA